MPPYPVLAQRATFTTTTVFVNGPTESPIASSGTVQVPIGAIVGGLLGGIVLAFAFVGGWIWWGKAIERKARKQQPHLRSALKRDPYREGKMTGTSNSASAHSSRRSLPRTHPMAMAAASQKSVTFAEEPTEETKPGTPSPAGSTRNSEDRGRPKFDRTSDDKTRTVDERTSDDRERGRAGSMTSPPVRSKFRPAPPRTPSAERAYAPTRPSPLAKEAVSGSLTSGRTTPSKSSTREGVGSRPPTRGMATAPLSRSPTPVNPVQVEFSTNTSKVVTPPPLAPLLSTQYTNAPDTHTQDINSPHTYPQGTNSPPIRTQDTNSPRIQRNVQPPPVLSFCVPPAPTPVRLSELPVPSTTVSPAVPQPLNLNPLPTSQSTAALASPDTDPARMKGSGGGDEHAGGSWKK